MEAVNGSFRKRKALDGTGVSKCKREGEGEGDQAHGRGPASEIEL